MHITMSRDKGAFKKGESYDLKLDKAKELLTHGYCVRVRSDKKSTVLKSKNKEKK